MGLPTKNKAKTSTRTAKTKQKHGLGEQTQANTILQMFLLMRKFGLKANARFCQDGTVEALCDIEAGAELFASYGASLAQFLPGHSAQSAV